MRDLDAYLDRIGLSGRPTIAELHRAHATSIPFENLDPWRGVPVSLASDDIERKLVAQRRGGYCFEHNLLLKAALEALGADVELMLARARVGAPPGAIRPRTHLVLRASLAGEAWLADAGFGFGGLLEPLPFGPGEPHEQSGWRFRVVQDGPELVLQAASGSGWVDQYGFVPEPAPFVDLETGNWYTSTHPHSPFVRGPIVACSDDDGGRALLRADGEGGFQLVEQTPSSTSVTPVARDAVGALLEGRFGLRGFAVGGDGRAVRVDR